MPEYDLLIRNGKIVDGLRVPAYTGDVAIQGGRIVGVGGRMNGSAKKTIDANGLIVAPGIIDLHTHYDAQLNWDPYATPSGWHGVTTVMIANCGFGFAPCRPEERVRAMQRMSRVEAMPLAALEKGMRWDWESFPEFLASLQRQGLGTNVASYLPTSPLRSFVMGADRARECTEATAEEIAQMKALFREAMEAGAFGFSVDRSPVNMDYDGGPLPSHVAAPAEFLALAQVLGEYGGSRGSISWAWKDQVRFCGEPLLVELARVSGCPVQVVVVSYNDANPELHKQQLAWLEKANQEVRLYGQTHCMEVSMQFMLADFNLFDEMPAWRSALTGRVEEKIHKLQDPSVRAALKKNIDECAGTLFYKADWQKVVVARVRREDHKRFEHHTIAEIAREVKRHPLDAMLDISLKEGLQTEFAIAGLINNNETAMRELLTHPYVHFSDSDAGAHGRYLMIGPWPTYFLTHWVREQGLVSLEEAHWRMSYLPAWVAGIKDRGCLREGMAADVVTYDFERLRLEPSTPVVAHDLPGGEWRLVQMAEGYRNIIVNGEVTFEDGRCTGALPGKVLHSSAGA